MANIGADIEFDAEGVTLRGSFFPVAGATRPTPCVVMAHGWAGEITHFIAEQIRDYQHAITYAHNRQDVDPDRIGA